MKKAKDRRESNSKAVYAVEDALEHALKTLKGRANISGWEIYLEEERRLAIEVKDGEVESLVSARTQGIGVRVVAGGRMGLSYTNDLFPGAIVEAVDRAREAAGYMSEDSCYGFAAPPDNEGWPELDIFDRGLEQVPEETKVRQAMLIESSALEFDPRVKRVRGAEYEEYITGLTLLNSEGVEARAGSTLVTGSLEAVAEDKSGAQAALEFETVHYYDKLNVVRIGEEAAKNATELLGGGSVPGGRYPVVLSPRAAAGMISVLAPAVFGDAVLKHRSWLEGKRGRKIANPAVSIVDDGLWQDGPAAFPFDDEGTASRRTEVIREGALENFLYDIYYGNRAGCGSTGNGLRPGYHFPPAVDTTNWVLLPGSFSADQLTAQVNEGLFIVELLGLHTADPATGEFSLGASGFRIRAGKLAEPITGIAMAGTLAELLERIEAVGDTVKFTGDSGSPAILIGEVDISGPDRERG